MLNRKTKIICVVFGIVFSLCVTGFLLMRKEQQLQRKVAEQVLRFHVLANSDSEADQKLKMEVKEEVLRFMQKSLPQSKGKEETKRWAEKHLVEIKQLAEEVIASKGYSYLVNADLDLSYFPDKIYGDITFPAGIYEALRIEIGEAKGQNWWCVLYPNLCFLNATHAIVPEEGKEELEEVLDEEAYNMVTSKTIFRLKWFFF